MLLTTLLYFLYLSLVSPYNSTEFQSLSPHTASLYLSALTDEYSAKLLSSFPIESQLIYIDLLNPARKQGVVQRLGVETQWRYIELNSVKSREKLLRQSPSLASILPMMSKRQRRYFSTYTASQGN